MIPRALWAVTAIALTAFVTTPPTISGPARVIDGDTIEVAGSRIRLQGIDAPELAQSCSTASGVAWGCGRESRAALAGLIGPEPVTCVTTSSDRYWRLLASCRVGMVDLGGHMVRTGFALAYRRYSNEYAADEEAARRAGRGIWSGVFVEPETYRHKGR